MKARDCFTTLQAYAEEYVNLSTIEFGTLIYVACKLFSFKMIARSSSIEDILNAFVSIAQQTHCVVYDTSAHELQTNLSSKTILPSRRKAFVTSLHRLLLQDTTCTTHELAHAIVDIAVQNTMYRRRSKITLVAQSPMVKGTVAALTGLAAVLYLSSKMPAESATKTSDWNINNVDVSLDAKNIATSNAVALSVPDIVQGVIHTNNISENVRLSSYDSIANNRVFKQWIEQWNLLAPTPTRIICNGPLCEVTQVNSELNYPKFLQDIGRMFGAYSAATMSDIVEKRFNYLINELDIDLSLKSGIKEAKKEMVKTVESNIDPLLVHMDTKWDSLMKNMHAHAKKLKPIPWPRSGVIRHGFSNVQLEGDSLAFAHMLITYYENHIRSKEQNQRLLNVLAAAQVPLLDSHGETRTEPELISELVQNVRHAQPTWTDELWDWPIHGESGYDPVGTVFGIDIKHLRVMAPGIVMAANPMTLALLGGWIMGESQISSQQTEANKRWELQSTKGETAKTLKSLDTK